MSTELGIVEFAKRGGAVLSDGGPLNRRRGPAELRILSTGAVVIARRGILGAALGILGAALPKEIVFPPGSVVAQKRFGGFIRFSGGPLPPGQHVDFQAILTGRIVRQLADRGIKVSRSSR